MRDSINADNPGFSEVESIESLRQILESEQGKSITQEEAQEIGEALIRLFEAIVGSEEADDKETVTAPQYSNQTD